MSHIFKMWGITLSALTLISIDICANHQCWWAVLWILGGLGCRSRAVERRVHLVLSRNWLNDSIEGKWIVSNCMDCMPLTSALRWRPDIQKTPRAGGVYYTCTWPHDVSFLHLFSEAWHKPPETDMTKNCRSAFSLLWSIWRLCSILESASSADDYFQWFFLGGGICDKWYQNSYLKVEP